MGINWNDAPEWASRVVKFSGKDDSYWAGCGNCQKIDGTIVYVMGSDDYEILSIRPRKLQKGEERMNNIAQNGGDGGHYTDSLTVNIDPIDILDDDPKTDVIEHGNNNGYSTKIKTIVIDGIDHDIHVDVYDVLTAFNVINPATAHAVKKQLKSGKRGVKGVIQDLTEARDSLNRAIEIERAK